MIPYQPLLIEYLNKAGYNAQIDREPAAHSVVGIHSIHDTSNDNGATIDLASSKTLRVKSTMLLQKRIHKQIRYHIDHNLVNSSYGNNIIDVRCYRGAGDSILYW